MNQQIEVGGDSIGIIKGDILFTVFYHAECTPANTGFFSHFILAYLSLSLLTKVIDIVGIT